MAIWDGRAAFLDSLYYAQKHVIARRCLPDIVEDGTGAQSTRRVNPVLIC
jgi:hypothetical protein